jgi:hypothetical protein
MRVVPWGWPDLHGFGDMVRGFEVEGEEHDEHEEHPKNTHTHKGYKSVSLVGPIHQPNRIMREIPLGRIPRERSTRAR